MEYNGQNRLYKQEGGTVVAMDQLTSCKTCSKEVAQSASKCPHCGAKLKMGAFEKVLIFIGASFVAIIIYTYLVAAVSFK